MTLNKHEIKPSKHSLGKKTSKNLAKKRKMPFGYEFAASAALKHKTSEALLVSHRLKNLDFGLRVKYNNHFKVGN